MNACSLKFEKGRFVLVDIISSKLRLKLRGNSYWKALDNDEYSTDNLKEAAAFRQCADEKVRKIFQRTFQERYRLPGMQLPIYLDPHQKEGIEWILSRKRSYLVHAPGAGKTCQAILSAYFANSPGQSLFIVPPGLRLNWEREILKFTDWLNLWPSIGVVKGTNEKDQVAWKADFLIVPDSMISKSWVQEKLLELSFKFIAVDEASRFKEITSERSLAFYGGRAAGEESKSFPGIFRDARHVVFLDGSPMPNRPMELFAPVYALDPESIDCMGYDDFGYRYCGAKPNERGVWEYKFSSNEEELRSRLTKSFMHVVPESALNHPERLRSMVFLNEDVRSPEQKTWEKKHLTGLSAFSDEMCKGEMARFRRELGLRKVPEIVRYVRERLENKDESILLFAWHRDVCLALSESLKKENPGLVMGGTTSSSRERSFADFISGKTHLLILNILAGGRGHNLQKATRVIFGECSWSDEVNKQAEKRASRKGSDNKNVKCEYLVSPGSMDEIVLNSVFTKQKRVERIIG